MQKILIVGAGFWGSVLAERLTTQNTCRVTLIDRRHHIGGNSWSEIDGLTGVEYHKYGSHIFHTSSEEVWKYVNQFSSFNTYRHTVWSATQKGLFPMPISLATINGYYGLSLNPSEARQFLAQEIAQEKIQEPSNLEEKAISLIGRPLYEAFIKGYTIKQWEKDPKELPESIITRLPLRFNYDTRYFSDKYEGIPFDGYGALFQRMLANSHIEVFLNTEFRQFYAENKDQYDLVLYSGPIDEFFDCQLGSLEWRTVDFEIERYNSADVQGTSVINYPTTTVPYTRVHEFKHFHPERLDTGKSIIFKEFSRVAHKNDEPYYPIKTQRNEKLFQKYRELAKRKSPHVIFGGRLGGYCYYDMDDTILAALRCYEEQVLPRLKIQSSK